MVLGLIHEEDPQRRPGVDEAVDLNEAIIEAVIGQVNREYERSELRNGDEAVKERIRQRIHVLVGNELRRRGIVPTVQDQTALRDEIARRLMGWGFLDYFLPPVRNDLTEVRVYSSGLIQVMKKGSVRWSDWEEDRRVPRQEVWRVVNTLLGEQSKSVSEATPIAYAKLPRTKHIPGGGRLTVDHPVIAPGEGYPVIALRLFEPKPVRPEWILERGAMNDAMMAFLQEQVQAGKRILITGGTRTGKTTMLSALCAFLPEHWVIVTIEDPQEIFLARKTVQPLEARPVPPGSDAAPITLADLVDNAMRLSPDYLILGEVRDGRAAMAMVRALLTGHSGATTFHSDTPREAFIRLAANIGADMNFTSRRDINQMIAGAVDVIVQIGIRHDIRRVTTIAMVEDDLKGGEVWFTPVWRYDESSPPDRPQWRKADSKGRDLSYRRFQALADAWHKLPEEKQKAVLEVAGIKVREPKGTKK